MAFEQKILNTLKKKFPEDLRSKEELVDYWRKNCRDDWAFGCGQLWDLGILRLVQNDMEGAKEIFFEGTKLALINNKIRENFPSLKKIQIETPLSAYLGGNIEMARPFAQYILSLVGNLDPTKDSKRAFWAWRWTLLALLLSDENRIKLYSRYVEDICDGFVFESNVLPSNINQDIINYAYSTCGIQMINGILGNNPELISENINSYSQVLTKALKRNDSSSALADLELIIIYDVAIGRGIDPKVDTPFIPMGIIKNGYWNTRA